MRYTLIPGEKTIEPAHIQALNSKELKEKIDSFCKRTGADPFNLDCVSDAESMREYEADKLFEEMH